MRKFCDLSDTIEFKDICKESTKSVYFIDVYTIDVNAFIEYHSLYKGDCVVLMYTNSSAKMSFKSLSYLIDNMIDIEMLCYSPSDYNKDLDCFSDKLISDLCNVINKCYSDFTYNVVSTSCKFIDLINKAFPNGIINKAS